MVDLASDSLSPTQQAVPHPTVLIVEDEARTAEAVALCLRHAGYTVLTAQDGLTAWRAVEEKRPDAVVLDLNLPVLSGFRLMQLIRRTNAQPQPRVVVTTGYSFQEARDVVKLGVDAFVEKPFDPDTLLRAVRFVLAKGRSASGSA